LATVHSQVLQNVATRIEVAFQAFFRRVKAGDKPGYPRFRGVGRYDSFCYSGTEHKLAGRRVFLSKIGHVKAVIHRPLEGAIKTCCVKRASTGKWSATFACEMVHNHCLAKSISGAAWSMFAAFLSYKAASAGRRYVAVNPAYTSQDCSRCGHRQKMSLVERVYRCPCCRLDLSRDHNAALNILSL